MLHSHQGHAAGPVKQLMWELRKRCRVKPAEYAPNLKSYSVNLNGF
ncbi:12217_t:CDS:1, partial [Entrophospora sp. SA101]